MGKKTTMEVRVGSCTVLCPELVNIHGDKYHIVITENEMGDLVIRSVDGRLWFQSLDTSTIIVKVETYPDWSAPDDDGE